MSKYTSAATLFGAYMESDDFDDYVFEEFLTYGGTPINGVEFVEQDGGGEGGSEYCHTVVKRKEDGKHFMLEYSYYSYQGFEIDWDRWVEVEPYTVKVTRYRQV